ncbi:MAG: hypothetical protein ACK4WK_06560, partial [Anaerolineae bacterium]
LAARATLHFSLACGQEGPLPSPAACGGPPLLPPGSGGKGGGEGIFPLPSPAAEGERERGGGKG